MCYSRILFFKTDDYLKTNNIIEDEEYLIFQSSNLIQFDWKGFKREIEQLKVIFNTPPCKMPLSKFIETIDLLIENTNEIGRVKHSKASLDIIEKYKSLNWV